MVSFNKKDAQRIGKVVKRVERDQFHPRSIRGVESWNQNTAQNFIPVKIKAVDEGNPPLHSWVRVELDTDGNWTEQPTWDKGGPDYDLDESSLIHPDHIAIEPDTVVLAHWSIDQGYLLACVDHIVAYKLLEPMTQHNLQATAKAVDGNGDEYGPEITVVCEPYLLNQFGPALEGWFGYGYYSPKRNSSSGDEPKELNVIFQQRFAKYIQWSVTGGLQDCVNPATVTFHWDGEEPENAFVNLACLDCSCYKGPQCGIACFDPTISTDVFQHYHIIFIDQMLRIASLSCDTEDICESSGSPVRHLLIGSGMEYQEIECTSMRCVGVLTGGIEVSSGSCSGSESESESEGESTKVGKLKFKSPLMVELEQGCPTSATISLEQIIAASGDACIDLWVTTENCLTTIHAAFDPYCSSGSGSGFSGSGCIEVTSGASGWVITDTTEVMAGEGINITSSGCLMTIAIKDLESGPAKRIEFLCDIDLEVEPLEITCVETSGGNQLVVTGGEITLIKKYGSITLPDSIIIASSGECGSGSSGDGSGGSGDEPPPPNPNCNVVITGIDCEDGSFSFEVTDQGPYQIEIVGDMGTTNFIDPYPAETLPGVYHGALKPGWGAPQPGECFLITVYDATQDAYCEYELCC